MVDVGFAAAFLVRGLRLFKRALCLAGALGAGDGSA